MAVAKAGGIEAVITTMRNHTSHEDVQHHGCSALVNISRLSANVCQQIVASGGKEVATQAVTKHDGHAGVQANRKELLATFHLSSKSSTQGKLGTSCFTSPLDDQYISFHTFAFG